MIYLIKSAAFRENEDGEEEFFFLLKIGYTKDIDSRFDTYLLHNPGCKLLGKREGDTELESFFHSYYSKYKYPKREEWFYYSQEIVDNFQTLEVGDKYLTKEEYIEGLRKFLKNNISTPKELKEKYLDDLLKEVESIKSDIKFNRNFHTSFTMNLWREGYEREMGYIDSYDFYELLKDFPERINLRENPWKSSATFYYRYTADYKKMSAEELQNIINSKKKKTEELIRIYENTNDNSSRCTLAKTYEENIRAYSYKNNYVAINRIVNDVTGDIILKPVINELVLVNELRAFKIQQIDYADRFTVFATIHNKITPDDIANRKAMEFMENYNNMTEARKKMIYLCECGLSRDVIQIVLDQIPDSDYIKSYYQILGPERLKALGYKRNNIERALGIITFSPELLKQEIYSSFREGEKLSLVYIKNLLSSIYSSVNYQSTPKATDLGNYFELKECLVPVIDSDGNKKRVRGYELLRSKRNPLEERLVD